MKYTLIEDLKDENNFAFGMLYKEYFVMINRFILNNSGRPQDSEDIFQDTMIVLLEKLRSDNFILTASMKTYIMAISKNLWLKRLRNRNKELDLSDFFDNEFHEELNLFIENEKSYSDKLQYLLHKITKHCQGLIHDIFFKEKVIEQIQIEYGYLTKHNAQNQKHKCVEQIRKVKEEEEKK